MTGFATKEELSQIKSALISGLAGVRTEIAEVKSELKFELELKTTRLKGELEVKIADVRSDVIRWMFAFFVATILAILGLYFKK